MGSLHPVLIHFPIVLLLFAVALEAIAFARRDMRLSQAARVVLIVGAVTTLFAFVCGNFAELWAARSGISQEALEYHEFLATVTSWLFVGLTGWRMLMRDAASVDGMRPTSRGWRAVWLAAGVGACGLLILTGHHGGRLVYDHGAAVQNVGLQRLPTHEDLFQLIQRQDEESIFYSNMMHHIFGWMVLLLSLLLLLDLMAPRFAEKARRFGPLLLFAGGVFLLIFSDQDAWPLYHVRPFRPITDKEILLHKTYALLMLAVGTRGLWQIVKTRFRRRQDVDAGQPAPNVQPDWRVQDRLMAVFALVGGALLFTHIHSAAPYANIAVGVYLHHTALGLGALSIGAIKLLDDALPRPARWRRYAYPALMCVEAVLLINYNEGLPWFLGYHNFSTVAPHGGLVAPLGPHRAELVYNPDTARLEMYILKPDRPEPVALPVSVAQAVVRVGEESTEIPLAANPGIEPRNAHFAGTAKFLRGEPLFTTRATVRVDGHEYVADFEPWIDRTQAIHSTARYVCPMHAHIGADDPGTCWICGMALEPNRPPRPSGQLHDPEYRLDMALSPAAPVANQPVGLALTLRQTQGNTLIKALETVHTKKLHLIIASRDLSFFDHVHPDEGPDGTYRLDYTFPHGGEFDLYADLTPTGTRNQVFRLPVMVQGTPAPSAPLHESAAAGRLVGEYRVGLTASPLPLKANDEATLTFTLSRDGKPVTDLEPYLGAGGHCVVLSEDTKDYLHSHPLELPGGAATGPQVTFHTRFPRSGLYKVWGQFQHQGKVLVADFVVRVP